jgi:two-component system sensor histidine kinase KdpD
MQDEPRPDPDALLAAAAREGRGRLKIFLGAAPGVGKTWEMLAAARRLHERGTDVLAGVIETHGRAETAAQLGDLPVLPRRRVPYRGQTLEEFDLDAALARRPALLLVDELAHTNAPGSRHRKRWEDVAELVEAGISVWATLNVQHLESLNDAIARITGVRVGETLPDRVLEMADEIEFIDLPPSDLRSRLREGRIYRADLARRALEGFFREGNLAALREIGLRTAAQHVDRDLRGYMREKAIPGPWPTGDRVLALVGDDAAAEAVVRQAHRLADALRTRWIALHVEHPGSVARAQPALDIAAQLGAEIDIRAGTDTAEAALGLAASRNVTHIVLGRSARPWWRRLRRGVATGLIRRGSAFALHIVPVEEAERRRAGRLARVVPGAPAGWLAWVVPVLLVAGVVAAGELFSRWLQHEALGMLFLAAVVAVATVYGLRAALLAGALGFLSWNFFFIEPLYRLTIYEPRDVIGILVFAGVAVATGWLGSRVRAEAAAAQGRIRNLRRITSFARALSEPPTEPELLAEIVRQAEAISAPALVMLGGPDGGSLSLRVPEGREKLDEGDRAAADWAFGHGEPAGRDTTTLPSAAWRFLPMRTVRGTLGVLGIRPAAPRDDAAIQALAALADQAAVAIERVRLATEAARVAAQTETQKLRTALLSSLSHDLRTPLTVIRGAAGTLRSSWDNLSGASRADLLATIEQDTVRMTRFLSNIMEMTRLESGEILPRRVRVPLGPVIEAALARVDEAGGMNLFPVNLPPGLPDVATDPALLEQVLVNVLENAIKYSPQSAPVRIGAEVVDGMVELGIADEGQGIAAEDLPHVFDSFYRARREDRALPGTGLGLAIARGLVEAMGGRIVALSPRPDAPRDGAPGTLVLIRLPVAGGGGE